MTGSGSVIDQLWVALGIRVDGDGLKEVKSQVNEAKESLISAGAALKTFIAGFAVHEIAKIGSTFEQNQIAIAGFLSALGLSSDFNAGLKDAEGVVNSITRDAAKWPGEADEYIRVFRAGLPLLKDAGLDGIQGIADFTNKLTAVAKTANNDLDIGTIARETREILEGRAMGRNNLFMSLLPLMKQVKGQAHLTAQSLNAMTAPKRVQLLQEAFKGMQPAIDASAQSFDAMWGAAVSAMKQMTRLATKPLFKGMKDALDQINAAFYNTDGSLTAFGHGIVDAVSTGTKYLTQFLSMAGHLTLWFAQSGVGAATFKTILGLLGAALAGLAVEKTAAGFSRLLGVVTNFKAILTGGLVAVLALVAEDLYQFATGGDSVTGLLVNRFGPAVYAGIAVLGLLVAALLATKLAALATAIQMAISWAIAFWPVTLAIAAIGGLIFGIYELKKHWGEIADFIAKKWQVVIDKIHEGRQALGLETVEPQALKAFVGGNFDRSGTTGDDTDTSFLNPLSAKRPHWTPVHSMAGGSGGSTTVTHVHHTDNSRPTFNIKSTDPKGAADEVSRRLTRDAHSKAKL